MCLCVNVMHLKSVCVTCDKGSTCLQTAGEEEGTEGSEGKAFGRKVWVFDGSENESNREGMKNL